MVAQKLEHQVEGVEVVEVAGDVAADLLREGVPVQVVGFQPNSATIFSRIWLLRFSLMNSSTALPTSASIPARASRVIRRRRAARRASRATGPRSRRRRQAPFAVRVAGLRCDDDGLSGVRVEKALREALANDALGDLDVFVEGSPVDHGPTKAVRRPGLVV